ncbi:hypothetical protein WG66_014718 [Moniliophthora roreri]|nr:hypothetical protein WG66_014718 [Moniliophthora roreri]
MRQLPLRPSFVHGVKSRNRMSKRGTQTLQNRPSFSFLRREEPVVWRMNVPKSAHLQAPDHLRKRN